MTELCKLRTVQQQHGSRGVWKQTKASKRTGCLRSHGGAGRGIAAPGPRVELSQALSLQICESCPSTWDGFQKQFASPDCQRSAGDD